MKIEHGRQGRPSRVGETDTFSGQVLIVASGHGMVENKDGDREPHYGAVFEGG
jgi:hypothetical protein